MSFNSISLLSTCKILDFLSVDDIRNVNFISKLHTQRCNTYLHQNTKLRGISKDEFLCLKRLKLSDFNKIDKLKEFKLVCDRGHLQVAKWLTDYFKLDVEDARSDNNYALRLSCTKGHLHVAKWLTSHFNLTSEDARSFDNHALRYSCEGGYLNVVKWLIERFELTVEDVRACNNYALTWSCKSGHLDVAKWLKERVGMEL